MPGEPEVVLWPIEFQFQRTVSPGWIVTDLGLKLKLYKLPTIVTVTVAALVVFWLKIRSGALIITTAIVGNAMVFIASVRLCNCNQSVASRNTGKVTPLLP